MFVSTLMGYQTNSSADVYGRYFQNFASTSTQCLLYDDDAGLSLPGGGSPELCAAACYRTATCAIFTFDTRAIDDGGGGCRFGPECFSVDEDGSIITEPDPKTDTYNLRRGSECDPQPLSDRKLDTCGIVSWQRSSFSVEW